MTDKPPQPQDERPDADEAFAATFRNLVNTPHTPHMPLKPTRSQWCGFPVSLVRNITLRT